MKRRLKGMSIIVIRWNGVKYKNSKPCKDCCEYMKQQGIKKVFYSNDDEIILCEKISTIKTEHICMSKKHNIF